MKKPGRTPKSAEADRGERLQKLLAAAGVASRRACERLIAEGRVSLNGQVVRQPGTRADPERDRIEVDGRPLRRSGRRRHYLLNKPRGVVTTARDPHAARTVLDLVPTRERLFPVGRLDAQSEGLLLLTNDGELAQAMLHPSFEVPRTYRVRVEGVVSEATLARIRDGIVLRGRRTARCEAGRVEVRDGRSLLELTLIEGRRRQIRDVMRAVGHPVRRLVRTRFGPLRLGSLEPGAWRAVTAREHAALARLRERASHRSRQRTR
jgi:pseudouridine synthase